MDFFESYSHTSKMYVSAIATTVGGTAGIAVGQLQPVPVSFCWKLARLSVWSNTAAANPVFELFFGGFGEVNTGLPVQDRTRRLEFSNVWAANGISDENHPPYFDENEVPIFVWSGLNNNDVAQACCQMEWWEKTPIMGRRDSRTVLEREYVEMEERATAEIVPASARDGWIHANMNTPDTLEANAYVPWTNAVPFAADESTVVMPPGTGQVVPGNERS